MYHTEYKLQKYKIQNRRGEEIASKVPPCKPPEIASNVLLVKLGENTSGHGPIGQPADLSQVQLSGRGVM